MAAAAEQKQYLVTWEIDIWAEDPKEAAEKARSLQAYRDSLATVYTVAGDDGSWSIDLTKDTQEPRP
jgi:hypothetical protein